MSKKIGMFFVFAFAFVGVLTVAGKFWNYFNDSNRVFVVTSTEWSEDDNATLVNLLTGKRRWIVTLKQERGYTIRAVTMTHDQKKTRSLYTGDRVSMDLMGLPHRL